MAPRRPNTQLFALGEPPPPRVTVAGRRWALTRVFKHDFYAATALYEAPGASGALVVKFYRNQDFCGLPLRWLGRASRDHERRIYQALAGVAGVPGWRGDVGATGLAIDYIPSRPLDHCPGVGGEYFDALRTILDAVHSRGVAYVDGNKRSNMLVDAAGRPALIDFQIALRRRDDWPWPLRALAGRLVAYFQGRDLYHLYKHKRRLAPGSLTDEQARLAGRPGGLHALHRTLTKPYRALRRRFLRRQYRAGRLVSPSAGLEDHAQPEKETWRT